MSRSFYLLIITISLLYTFISIQMFAQIPTNGLVAYYPFNENSNDESGNSNNGLLRGQIAWGNDRFGRPNGSIKLNGEDSYIAVPPSASLNSPLNGVTISSWVNIDQWDNGQWAIICAKNNRAIHNNQYFLSVSIDPSNIHEQIYAGLDGVGNFGAEGQSIPFNEWHFVAFSWSGDSILFYLDGQKVAAQSAVGTLIQNTDTLYIGADFPGQLEILNGLLDDLRIYSRALDSVEIRSLYHEGELVAYYPFTNSSAADSSGNGNHGTGNGVTYISDRFGNSNKSAFFNGGANVEVNDDPSLDITGALTLEAWISPDDVWEGGIILSKWAWLAGQASYIISFAGENNINKIRFGISPNGAANNDEIRLYSRSSIPENSGNWYHVVAVFSPSQYMKIFINGIEDTILTVGIPSKLHAGTAPLFIGKENNGANIFVGKMDDIRIYSRALTSADVRSLYGNYRQSISAILDVPNDQGGKVRIKWDRIYLDSAGLNPQISSYGIWRKIPPGSIAKMKAPNTMMIANDTLGTLYDFLGSVNAVQSPQYNFVANTLSDSSASGQHNETFLITAHTADPNVYYISDAGNGHSVDNLAPAAATSLVAVIQAGPSVKLDWNQNTTDRDFRNYEVYRSLFSNFTPIPSLRIGSTSAITFTDATVTAGNRYYYRIVNVDIHDNGSAASPQAPAGIDITQTYSVNDMWNMVSLPLDVLDPSKAAVFPSAVSNAFTYNGAAYAIQNSLSHGHGYWVKFNAAKSVPITGYLHDLDTIDIQPGWNMIGSISTPVSISSIVSIPSGITVSHFFAYKSNRYEIGDTIQPGSGYWIKANQAGKLVLAPASEMLPKAGRLIIASTSEEPPSPPELILSAGQNIPNEYSLSQNYPNPFNPTTTIKYGLPQAAQVTLSVYNTLGQRVALLVDEKLEAGYHEAVFDGVKLSSGVYFYRIQADTYTDTKKLLLVK